MDDAQLALRNVDGLILASFFQFDEKTATDYKSQEWIYNLFSFVYDFDIWNFHTELPE